MMSCASQLPVCHATIRVRPPSSSNPKTDHHPQNHPGTDFHWSCPVFVDGFRFEGLGGGWCGPFVVGG